MGTYTREQNVYTSETCIHHRKSSSGLFNQSSFVKEGSSSNNQFIKNEIINKWFDTYVQRAFITTQGMKVI